MTELCWQAVGLILGAGTWLPGTSPWWLCHAPWSCFWLCGGCSRSGLPGAPSPPTGEPLYFHFIYLDVHAPQPSGLRLSRACRASRRDIPLLTRVEHEREVSHPSPDGVEGAFACISASVSSHVPLSPCSWAVTYCPSLVSRISGTGPPDASPGCKSTPSFPMKGHGIRSGAFLLPLQENL